MASFERKAHVRDLVQLRLFMRELIESKSVGAKQVGNHITNMSGWNPTLESIYEEELNYQEYLEDPVLRRDVKLGKRVMAFPVADLCIVKTEDESTSKERRSLIKRKVKTKGKEPTRSSERIKELKKKFKNLKI